MVWILFGVGSGPCVPRVHPAGHTRSVVINFSGVCIKRSCSQWFSDCEMRSN
jgi:hypothetical protein